MEALYIFVPILLLAMYISLKQLKLKERELLLKEKKYRDSTECDCKSKR